ncbi:MAG: AbrB/MazE/SpoVT family DNA-binding domain-containing protein [Bifidobacteriaceae bacterium]|jgi:AbrB family looped-hinge helix DNA binding protein|nr:AbrB/MazE/SpoVT family DNA-binding domain-containing protein [Bifidobacteriaceae bacterium]
MELAKVTTRGQITLPVAIRRRLNVREGGKVVFIEDQGRVVIENAGMLALRDMRDAARGAAESLGIHDEQGVADLIEEVREARRQRQ